MANKPLQMLSIGDITVDAFIRIKDAKVHCKLDTEQCELCVRFGDKIPYESVTIINGVGNAANASVSAARLGVASGFLGVVGSDQNGEDCLEGVRKDNVDVSFCRKQEGTLTNYHYVLWYEAERTILVKHYEYDYSIPENMPVPEWIYLSSLGENSLPFHGEIATYLQNNKDVKLAFQPGTFQMKLGVEALKGIYDRTEIIFINKEEAQRILGSESQDTKELLAGMHALGPKIVVITDGRNGVSASDGKESFHVPMFPDRIPPVDRTGAGDATASTTVAALILGLPLREAITWGPINSMAVVEQVGAQKGLLTKAQMEELLASAPADYKSVDIS